MPLGADAMTIGRSSESGLVIRDDYTSSHHARLLLRGDTVDDPGPRLHRTAHSTTARGWAELPPSRSNIGDTIKVGATTFELRA